MKRGKNVCGRDAKFLEKMRERKKGRRWMGGLLLGILLIAGCAKPGGTSSGSAEPTSPEPATRPAFSQDLANLFPKDKEVEHLYHGYAEYGQSVRFMGQEERDGVLALDYQGKVEDGYGNNTKDRSFSIRYRIDDQKVVQHIENNDPLRSQDKDGTMESLIPDKVVLQLPLTKGNSWTQRFTWQEKTYTATSTITSVGKTPDGDAYYEVKTQVPGMSAFYGGAYREGMIFEENRGMISFYHAIPEAAVQLSSGVTPTEDMYLFGFSFTKTQPHK